MQENRIFFKYNPYPLGHVIKEFVWSGHLDEVGQLWFDLHLKTDDYYTEDSKHAEIWDDEEEQDKGDWDSKIVWGNYHNCTMSSTYWGSSGILIDANAPKLNFTNWPVIQLIADTLPQDYIMPTDLEWDDLALNIYLLGHDACANHTINISQVDKNLFNINLLGKIALAYAGEDEFKYDFSANITDVKFDGFDYPQEMTQTQARKHFGKYIANSDDFSLSI
jgi:hypothetical protein